LDFWFKILVENYAKHFWV